MAAHGSRCMRFGRMMAPIGQDLGERDMLEISKHGWCKAFALQD